MLVTILLGIGTVLVIAYLAIKKKKDTFENYQIHEEKIKFPEPVVYREEVAEKPVQENIVQFLQKEVEEETQIKPKKTKTKKSTNKKTTKKATKDGK